MTRGKRLRLLREAADLDAGTLAKLAGVGLNTISYIENDKHGSRGATLEKLAGALGVPVAALEDDEACFVELERLTGVVRARPASLGEVGREVAEFVHRLGPERARFALQALQGMAGMLGAPPAPGQLRPDPGTHGVGDSTARGHSADETEGYTAGAPVLGRKSDPPGSKPRQP